MDSYMISFCIIRMILSFISLIFLVHYIKVKGTSPDLHGSILFWFLFANIFRYILYIIGVISYFITEDASTICPYYAVLVIANDAWAIVLAMIMAFIINKKYLDRISRIPFCCDRYENDVAYKKRNFLFFCFFFLVIFWGIMIMFYAIGPQQFSTSDFRCYAKPGFPPIIMQLIGIFFILSSYFIAKWIPYDDENRRNDTLGVLKLNLLFLFLYIPLMIRDIYKLDELKPIYREDVDIVLAYFVYISLSAMGGIFAHYLKSHRNRMEEIYDDLDRINRDEDFLESLHNRAALEVQNSNH